MHIFLLECQCTVLLLCAGLSNRQLLFVSGKLIIAHLSEMLHLHVNNHREVTMILDLMKTMLRSRLHLPKN